MRLSQHKLNILNKRKFIRYIDMNANLLSHFLSFTLYSIIYGMLYCYVFQFFLYTILNFNYFIRKIIKIQINYNKWSKKLNTKHELRLHSQIKFDLFFFFLKKNKMIDIIFSSIKKLNQDTQHEYPCIHHTLIRPHQLSGTQISFCTNSRFPTLTLSLTMIQSECTK